MTNSRQRQSFWDASKREAYDKAAETTKQSFVDKREGQQIAGNLKESVKALDEEARAFLEYLLLIKRRVVIALDEEDLFDALVEKGFLQVPPGVGVLFKRYNQTTYSVPSAIWAAMTEQSSDDVFPINEAPDMRAEKLKSRFSHRIDATIKSEDGFIDLPNI